MRRVTRRIATRRNPEEQIGTVIGIGPTIEAAERDADKHLRQLEQEAAEAVHANRARPKRRRKNKAKGRFKPSGRVFYPSMRKTRKKRNKSPRRRKTLNFGERMKRLRAKKARNRKR